MKKYFQFDKLFFWLTTTLVVIGLFVFLSASFSAFSDPVVFKAILFNQLGLGLVGGIILFFIMLRLPIEYLKKYALFIYGFGIILLILVFVPHIGFAHGGARRWLDLGPLSFQSVEFAKYAVIIYLAAWLSVVRQKITNISQGLIPFAIIVGIVGVLLIAQPDTDSFLIILVTSIMMYLLAGAKWRDIGIMFATVLIAGAGLVAVRPYLLSRVKSFVDPSRDALGSSYQVQQQLIAIGSGKLTGRGFGQSIEKFQYLPEPLGDSVFAVAGEEFGFIGLVVIILIYTMFFFRGIWIANRTQDSFGKLLVVGILGLIVFQSLLNIASATAVFPLGGLPLMFISQGGTALAFAIGAVGIILNISRNQGKHVSVLKD